MSVDDTTLMALLARGYYRVQADGAVWQHMTRSRTGRWRDVPPRRVDYVENNGYRRVRFGKRGKIAAHRIAWIAQRGAIPDGVEINHRNGDKADNRIENLELVTRGDNMRHAFGELGVYHARGERSGSSKLTAVQVAEIRNRAAAGEAKRSLARAFGVTPPAIRRIVSRRGWRHVP